MAEIATTCVKMTCSHAITGYIVSARHVSRNGIIDRNNTARGGCESEETKTNQSDVKMRAAKYFYDSQSGARTWLASEVLELVAVFEEHRYLFGVMFSDEDVWILMASALQRRGVDVTAVQVKNKWLRMRRTFHSLSKLHPSKQQSNLPAASSATSMQKIATSIPREAARIQKPEVLDSRVSPVSACMEHSEELCPCLTSDYFHLDLVKNASYENLKLMYDLSRRIPWL